MRATGITRNRRTLLGLLRDSNSAVLAVPAEDARASLALHAVGHPARLGVNVLCVGGVPVRSPKEAFKVVRCQQSAGTLLERNRQLTVADIDYPQPFRCCNSFEVPGFKRGLRAFAPFPRPGEPAYNA